MNALSSGSLLSLKGKVPREVIELGSFSEDILFLKKADVPIVLTLFGIVSEDICKCIQRACPQVTIHHTNALKGQQIQKAFAMLVLQPSTFGVFALKGHMLQGNFSETVAEPLSRGHAP